MSASTAERHVALRNLKISDFESFAKAYQAAYKNSGIPCWSIGQYTELLTLFPEGQICVEINGEVVAAALSLIVEYSRFGEAHSYNEVTDDMKFTPHNPDGDVLYGIEVFVHSEYQGMRLGQRLYDGRKELCENLNLRAILAGGRIPGYRKYAEEMRPKEYIEKVRFAEIYDPILSFQLANGFNVKRILTDYMPKDRESQEFATLIEWNNIYYESKPKLINARRQWVRLGLVQWQMRSYKSVDELVDALKYFVSALASQKADFVVFPEMFNLPLVAEFKAQSEAEALRSVSSYTDELRSRFVDLAIAFNVNIVAGSMPLVDEGQLFSISYLCRRDGSWDACRKLHPSPSERFHWGMVGGEDLPVFDTDCGRIAILIEYDVEFPELGRLCADQGARIIFVPFLTDSPHAYHRLRYCAQARAIENECYVAIAGCVGNLPRVRHMDIQYAQSAVFSPADFAFPTNAVLSEAPANTESTVVCDLNLDLLTELHSEGSAQVLNDRRQDLYKVTWES